MSRILKSLALISMFASLASLANAAMEPKHSKVEARVNKATGKPPHFEFIVKTIGAIVVNDEGPWQLTLKKHDGLEFAKAKLVRADFNEKLPGFSLQATKAPKVNHGQIEYQLISFICTKNKEQCYREVHNGKLDW